MHDPPSTEFVSPARLHDISILNDDCGFLGCEGVTRMVNDFCREHSGFTFVHNLNGHALLIKTDHDWRPCSASAKSSPVGLMLRQAQHRVPRCAQY
jgi:hypothetical protein